MTNKYLEKVCALLRPPASPKKDSKKNTAGNKFTAKIKERKVKGHMTIKPKKTLKVTKQKKVK